MLLYIVTRIFIGTGIGTPSADSADSFSADSADTVPIDFEVSALTKLLPNKQVLRISADSADTFTKFFMAKNAFKVAWSHSFFGFFVIVIRRVPFVRPHSTSMPIARRFGATR